MGEFSPAGLEFAAELFPLSFDAIFVHFCLRTVYEAAGPVLPGRVWACYLPSTNRASASTSLTPLMARAVATALSTASWSGRAPVRVTVPFSVLTLMLQLGTPLVVARSAFSLVVIQVSSTTSAALRLSSSAVL